MITVLTALLLYPLIWTMLVLTLAVCALYYLGPLRYVALLMSWPLYGIAKLTLWLVGLLSDIPYAYIHVRSTYFYIWTAFTLIIGIIAYLLRKRYRLYPHAALFSAIVFFSGMIVNTVVQLNTNVLEYEAGKEGAAVYLNDKGRLHMIRFDCDSSTANRMYRSLSDEFGGAYTEVCTAYIECVNYHNLSFMDFPVAHYLMYRGVDDILSNDFPDDLFYGNSVFMLDDDLTLYTVEDDDKTLLYLIDGEKSVLQLPSGFSYDAIPAEMRYADIIMLKKADQDYDKLSCDTLIYCNHFDEQEKLPLPKSDSKYDLTTKHLSFDMN